ncbi:MAG: hypothetical protein WA139_04795 [Candidatus Aenigmatarchaeota archaeon]
MATQELTMDCPFCEKAKIKVRYRPSITIKKRTVSGTYGTKYNSITNKEAYDVMEDCPNCGKTKEEIKKRLIEGKPVNREAILKRMKEAGIDPAKIKF